MNTMQKNILVLHYFKLLRQLREDARALICGHVHIKAVHAAGLNISLFYSTFSSQTTDSRDFIYNILKFCFSNLHAISREHTPVSRVRWLVRTESVESLSCWLDNMNESFSVIDEPI